MKRKRKSPKSKARTKWKVKKTCRYTVMYGGSHMQDYTTKAKASKALREMTKEEKHEKA